MNRAQTRMVKEKFEDWLNICDLRVVDILSALAEYCEDEALFQSTKHSQPDKAVGLVWQNYADEIKSLASELDKQ